MKFFLQFGVKDFKLVKMLAVWLSLLVLLAVAEAKPGVVKMSQINLPLMSGSVRLRYDPYDETWTSFKQQYGKCNLNMFILPLSGEKTTASDNTVLLYYK